MKTLETLVSARKKIERPENWCQGAYQRDADGAALTFFGSDKACKWCIRGAVWSVANGSDSLGPALGAIEKHALRVHEVNSPRFNDSHSHAEVLALLDAVIEELAP